MLLRLALGHLQAGRVTLTLVGGAPATGKSTLARELGDRLASVVLRSDEVRKELAGLTAATPAGAPLCAGVYTPAMTSLTYGELLHRARGLLERGESVILDATWADPSWRQEARRVAGVAGAEPIELRCHVAVSVAAERARRRGPDASDAGPEVAVALAERFAPWPEATLIDTNGPPARSTELAVTAAAPSRSG